MWNLQLSLLVVSAMEYFKSLGTIGPVAPMPISGCPKRHNILNIPRVLGQLNLWLSVLSAKTIKSSLVPIGSATAGAISASPNCPKLF
jgi:hypothetical protein